MSPLVHWNLIAPTSGHKWTKKLFTSKSVVVGLAPAIRSQPPIKEKLVPNFIPELFLSNPAPALFNRTLSQHLSKTLFDSTFLQQSFSTNLQSETLVVYYITSISQHSCATLVYDARPQRLTNGTCVRNTVKTGSSCETCFQLEARCFQNKHFRELPKRAFCAKCPTKVLKLWASKPAFCARLPSNWAASMAAQQDAKHNGKDARYTSRAVSKS